jgi:hypothetical protein
LKNKFSTIEKLKNWHISNSKNVVLLTPKKLVRFKLQNTKTSHFQALKAQQITVLSIPENPQTSYLVCIST